MAAFIKAATQKYQPKKKPAVIGASQGGDLSYMLALNYPGLISGAFPLLAVLDEIEMKDSDRKNVETIVRIFHGKNDSVVPIESVRTYAEHMRKKNYDCELFEYEDCDHQIALKMKEDYTNEITKLFESK